ncbi:MAG: DUF4215 domain-containing protein [Deltaproteobacteria bacterium]|nr:DUF4215 domain-containing protein [Deltaproteobacteria bacterium]
MAPTSAAAATAAPNPGPGGNPDTNPPPATPVCGNGIVETGEQCDDGNLKDNDACSSQCFPLPVLQGGGTSTSGPLEPDAGGCSLGTSAAQSSTPAWMGILALGGLLPVLRRKKTR